MVNKNNNLRIILMIYFVIFVILTVEVLYFGINRIGISLLGVSLLWLSWFYLYYNLGEISK